MNTIDYRNKLREGMSLEERNRELYRFSDYMANGNGTKQARKHLIVNLIVLERSSNGRI